MRFTSPRGGALSSAAGLPIADTIAFTPPDDGVVVICGGSAWEADTAPDLTDALRQSLDNGCVVAAICGGTVALANAGLLDGVRHTSNGADYLPSLSKAYRGIATYVDQPQALRDGQIITAPAPAPASFAYEVLAAAGLPEDAARQVKDMLRQEHQR
ncbi:DJ-1/PfpI family protein [Devosia aurantiaca]|uniref:DJ-1/PfpI family protein n=1 Tax=Devosia aurantiaca TaxID=2714858 RepID=UPI002E2A9B7B|nr:DJ-1/PfpI family protein [Devosia aurantiaca]